MRARQTFGCDLALAGALLLTAAPAVAAAFAPAGTPTAGDIPANSLRLLVFDLRVKAFATFQESSLSH